MCAARTISVILPTTALGQRRILLRRALQSILDQEGVRTVPLIVINGPQRDPDLVRELQSNNHVRVRILEDADLPRALAAGRDMVDTEWFAELDDDDTLLPGALAYRVSALDDDAELDVVVTNGIRRGASGDTVHLDDLPALRRDPLRALLRGNWLLPGSWLCRTRSGGRWLFDGMPAFRECTYLALQFATRCRLQFLERPTVIWHTDTAGSLSRSREYVLAGVSAHQRFLELDLPDDVRTALQRAIPGLQNGIARLHLEDGRLREAWAWHVRSLREPGGWRQLPFTRHFLRALWTS